MRVVSATLIVWQQKCCKPSLSFIRGHTWIKGVATWHYEQSCLYILFNQSTDNNFWCVSPSPFLLQWFPSCMYFYHNNSCLESIKSQLYVPHYQHDCHSFVSKLHISVCSIIFSNNCSNNNHGNLTWFIV